MSLLTIAYITIIFKEEPWEGEVWVEVPFILLVGSVNGYVVSCVASQDEFSRILELRFQKVKI